MNKRLASAFVGVGLAMIIWFAACHSFTTVKDSANTTDAAEKNRQIVLGNSRVKGLIYYLPRGRIRISGDFKSAGGDGGTPQSPGKPPAASPGSRSLARAGGPSEEDSAAQKNFVVTIAADVEADPSARCYLKPVRNYFYDDEIALKVNERNLLSTGNATAEDQTARIISTTAQLVAQVAAPGPKAALLVQETIPGKISISALLREIEDAVSENKVSIDDKIPVTASAVQELGNVLPGLESETDLPKNVREDIKIVLAALRLKEKNSTTFRDVRGLLRLYPASFGDHEIDLAKAPAFRSQLQSALNPTSRTKREYIQPRPFSVVFDPAIESKAAHQTYKVPVCDPDDCGLSVTITEERQPELSKLERIWEGRNNDTAHGIAFRALKPYRIKIESKGTSFYLRESRLVLLPDICPEHTLVLDYSRLAFVKKTTNVTFVDGVPQNLAQKAPSSVLGFLEIPKGIIQALVPLSPGIIGSPGGVQGPGTSGTTAAPAAPPTSAPSPTPAS